LSEYLIYVDDYGVTLGQTAADTADTIAAVYAGIGSEIIMAEMPNCTAHSPVLWIS
jgi:hypothetical protein